MTADLLNLVNLVLKLGDWINTIWNFHAVINIAVLGWWLTKQPNWQAWQKAVLSLVYALVMAFNLEGQIITHRELDVVAGEIAVAAQNQTFKTPAMKQLLMTLGDSSYLRILFRHLSVDFFVLAVLWWPQARTRKKDQKPATKSSAG